MRAVDPVIPLVAADLAVSTATAALLSTAFALPYALTPRSSDPSRAQEKGA